MRWGFIFFIAMSSCSRKVNIDKFPVFDTTQSSLSCTYTENVRITEAEALCKVTVGGGFTKVNIFLVNIKLIEADGKPSDQRIVEILMEEEGAATQIKKCGVTDGAGETKCCLGIVSNNVQVKFTYSVIEPRISLEPVSCSSF